MATVPIEVILQDAEVPVDPTPTPEQETDISVPETGIISNGNGGGSIGSAASIILPAIIAVLAIGAVVAMILNKHRKHTNSAMSRKEKLATAAGGTIAILAATVLVGNLVIPATNAATDDAANSDEGELVVDDKITITITREAGSDSAVIANVDNLSYATVTKPFGYEIAVSMASDNSNLYLDGDETSEYYFSPVEDGVLENNTWGYTLDEEEYNAVPLVGDFAVVASGNTAVSDEEINVQYGIKVSSDMPVGTYTGELEYILSDTGFPLSLRTMQDMTTEICEDAYTPGNSVTDPVPTATLEDIRDHKTYTIAKLADGKCWMTQNLDLELSTEKALTPADTDVTENWTPMRSTISFTGTTVDGWQDDDNTPYSADPGDVYYYTSGTDTDDIQYNSLAECEAEHSDGTCQHYHAGNYYSWSAAVASNDTFELIGDGSTASSICPAGWRLPVNEGLGADDVNEQKKVITAYDEIVGEWAGKPWERYYNYQNGGFNSLRRNPIWLVRAGMISFISGSLSSSGISGYYWSSSYSAGGHMANGGNFNSNYIQPDAGNGWPAGYSVRCIAQ